MRHTLVLLALIIAFAAANAIAQPPPEEEKDPDKERLGLRCGYVETDGGLNEAFGPGMNLALHFITRLKRPLYVDVTLGAFYLGKTERTDITRSIFGTDFDKVTMRIMTITAAPTLEIPIGGKTNMFVSGGLGYYVASLILDQNIQQFDLTNNHFGVNAAAGLNRRISTNWSLDLSFQLHKFWTNDNNQWTTNPDWIYIYSEGDVDPLFWSVTGGVALRLF